MRSRPSREHRPLRWLPPATALLLAPTVLSLAGEIKTAPHPSEPVWMANGGTYRIGIYADNTGVAPGPHTDLVQWGWYQHAVFTTDLFVGSELPTTELDFFGGAPTDDMLNGPGTISDRFTIDFGAGPAVGEGQGFLVFYRFVVPENTPLGRYHFTLSPSTSNTYMTNEYAVKQAPVTIGYDRIVVVPDLPAMAAATGGPGISSNPSYDFDPDGDVDLADWAAAQVLSSQDRD